MNQRLKDAFTVIGSIAILPLVYASGLLLFILMWVLYGLGAGWLVRHWYISVPIALVVLGGQKGYTMYKEHQSRLEEMEQEIRELQHEVEQAKDREDPH